MVIPWVFETGVRHPFPEFSSCREFPGSVVRAKALWKPLSVLGDYILLWQEAYKIELGT